MANEKRLIAYDAVYQYAFDGVHGGGMEHEDFDAIINAIDAVPTIDAVEVCRCKDCKHWLHVEDGFGDCTNPRFHLPGHADPAMNADDFCSCGERRTESAHCICSGSIRCTNGLDLSFAPCCNGADENERTSD